MTRAPVGRSPLPTETALLLASFVLLASPPRSEAGSTACFDGDPAVPVPEFVNGEKIWPPSGLQPVNPGEQLPPERDSTRYVGLPTQLPGAGSGLELFTDLDIVGNYLYMSYNAGLQVWDIGGAAAANPVRLTHRDGFTRHFLEFEKTPTEVYFLLFGIDAIDPPTAGDDVLIALAGQSPAGFSVWDATNKSSLRQLYQDPDRWGEDVAAANIHGRTYAFYAGSAGGGAGLHVYDMTSARSLGFPCLEGRDFCPGVYRGEMGEWFSVRFVSHLERNNRHYVAVSDGSTSGMGISIHEVIDPAFASSAEIFSGLPLSTQGVDLFSHGGRAYLAVKGTNGEIYDVTSCLDSRSCTSLQAATPEWSAPVGNSVLVTASQADVPYVYFGTTEPCLQGTKEEHLFNVGSLGTIFPDIEEATEFPAGSPPNADGKFPDPQAGHDVDYWGHYLDRNSTGFSFLIPRTARAHRAATGQVYVYRAAFTVFDVHQFGGASTEPDVPSAVVSLAGEESPNSLWLGDDIGFVATPQNCEGTASWQWWSRASGQLAVSLGLDDSTHTHRWSVGAAQGLDVGATKLACDSGETMTEDDVTPVSVLLRDPRPVIPGIAVDPGGGSYPHGRQLAFSPSEPIAGKQPFGYQWRVLDGEGEPVSLPESAGEVFNLDTCDLPFDVTDIFADGFESGDTLRWSFAVLPLPGEVSPDIFADGFESGDTLDWLSEEPPAARAGFPEPSIGSGRLAQDALLEAAEASLTVERPATAGRGRMSRSAPLKAAQAMFTVEFTATANVDEGSFSDVETSLFEIIQPGDPAFDVSPFSSTDLGLGNYQVTAHTNGLETEVRWEIEDDNGTDTCSFGDCVILDWGEEATTVTHVWTTPNVAGPHTVRAAIRSGMCDGSFTEVPPQEIALQVENITTPVAPSVTQFDVVEGGEASCSCPLFGPCVCNANQPVTFIVTTDVPVTSIEFTWGDGQAQSVAPSEDDLYTHTYTSPGFYAPTVQAVSGELSSPVVGLPKIDVQIQ